MLWAVCQASTCDSLSHALARGRLCSHIPVSPRSQSSIPALSCWHHLEHRTRPIPCDILCGMLLRPCSASAQTALPKA